MFRILEYIYQTKTHIMGKFTNKTVLITGGASGIGFIMAKIVLAKGASNLIIWDINPDGLNQAITDLKKINQYCYGYPVDVSSLEQVKISAEKVKSEVGTVDILINNAGIVFGNYFHEHTHEQVEQTMSINSNALMHITLEFLPDMLKQNSGHLINIASAAGMVANPQMSVYCASKWAVIGWSDSVRLEMKKLKKQVKVTTVTPYYINTGMFDRVKSLIPIQNPEKATRKIIKGIERNRAFVRVPLIIYTLPLIKGLLPTIMFDWFVGKVLGVYKTMEHFKGRD
jgi:short-subunit dehydrogenase